MENQGDPTIPPKAHEPTPPTVENGSPKENEFVGLMNSLEALNEGGRAVVDVIPEDKERGLPKAVVIPARGELDRDGHKGTVFVTQTGVFIDFNGDVGMLDQGLASQELLREKVGDRVRDGYSRFTSWNVIDQEVRSNGNLNRGEDNGASMIRYIEQRYRNPERYFDRATPEQLKTAKDRAVRLAPNPTPVAAPSAYMDAIK